MHVCLRLHVRCWYTLPDMSKCDFLSSYLVMFANVNICFCAESIFSYVIWICFPSIDDVVCVASFTAFLWDAIAQ